MSHTVYISNMGPDHDYSKASTYGALCPITSGNYPVFKTGRLLEEITSVLVNSQPDDYLVLSGSNLVAALCTAVWLMKHNRVRFLVYDRPNGYVERVVSAEEMHLLIEKVADEKGGTPEAIRRLRARP